MRSMEPTATTFEFLAQAGQLLLEYNESSKEIDATLRATANSLTNHPVDVSIHYNGIVLSLGEEVPVSKTVRELRYNQALLANAHDVLRQVRCREIDAGAAIELLNAAVRETPKHSPWLVAVMLGIAAASLARILGADFGAMTIAGLASAIGLIVRKLLGYKHVALLVHPFGAALIGAVLGGVAIRFGWTATPGLALIVPSLMLVPGPHLLNGLFDLFDNYVPMAVSRLALATAIVMASAVGIVWGIEITLPEVPIATHDAVMEQLTLIADMGLAALVTCGFALFYNATWQQTLLAAVGGMAGHGARFVALGFAIRVEIATLIGGLVVGAVAAWIGRKRMTPVAVIAFAGAVTMMPGVQMYRALAGTLKVSRLRGNADPELLAAAMGHAFQSAVVVLALALGLIIAEKAIERLQKTDF
jgi:uncharacterized membrane protein YjjP (DUF1212 family)